MSNTSHKKLDAKTLKDVQETLIDKGRTAGRRHFHRGIGQGHGAFGRRHGSD